MQQGVIDPHSQGHPDMWRLSRIPDPDSFQHIALLWCQLSVGQVIEVKPPLSQTSLRTQLLEFKCVPSSFQCILPPGYPGHP